MTGFVITALGGARIEYFTCARCDETQINERQPPEDNLIRHCCDDCFWVHLPGRLRWKHKNGREWKPKNEWMKYR